MNTEFNGGMGYHAGAWEPERLTKYGYRKLTAPLAAAGQETRNYERVKTL